jgi:hypothetical protein
MNAPEIEITPEMIEAGERCLNNLLDGTIQDTQGLHCIPEGWAELVYRAMAKVAAANQRHQKL